MPGFARTSGMCDGCPFDANGPGYLRRERAVEIATAVGAGSPFPCHKTVDHDDDGHADVTRSQHCAGALIAQMAASGPGQLARIAARMGRVDLDRFDVDPDQAGVVRLEHLADHHDPDPDRNPEADYCAFVDYGCENPAGFASGSGAVANPDGPQVEWWCPDCGQPACDACRGDADVCPDCAEWAAEESSGKSAVSG